MRSRAKELILKLLHEHPEGILQSYIHKALGISKSRVSEVLKELERSGVIVRVKIGNQYLVKISRSVHIRERFRKVLRLGIVWSSEYPFITLFAKYLNKHLGYSLNIIVYSNALRATWALVNGELDLVLSPLITQLYAYSLTKALRIIGGGAFGGSFIVKNPLSNSDVVASSELSAMDACRAIAVREGLIDTENTYYFSNPKHEVQQLVKSNRAKYLVIWHPLIEAIIPLGFKSIATCSDLGIYYCCTLASRTTLDPNLRSEISRIYTTSIEEFTRNPGRCFEWYSLKVGIPVDVLKKGMKYYGFRPYIDKDLVYKMLLKVGINVPSLCIVREAIES